MPKAMNVVAWVAKYQQRKHQQRQQQHSIAKSKYFFAFLSLSLSFHILKRFIAVGYIVVYFVFEKSLSA